VNLVRNVSDDTAKSVVAAAHNVVNCAHNNGPFLSKFVGRNTFDDAANVNMLQTVREYFNAYKLLTDKPVTTLASIGKLKRFRIEPRKTSNEGRLQFHYRNG
jgi:hypothetical protein